MSKEPIQIKKKRGGNNNQNLVVPTSEAARINGRKGGLATSAKNKEKKTLKELLEALLEGTDESTGMTRYEEITLSLYKKAQTGDTKAFEVIRDSIGQKPQDNIKIDLNTNLQEMSTEQKIALAEQMRKELGL